MRSKAWSSRPHEYSLGFCLSRIATIEAKLREGIMSRSLELRRLAALGILLLSDLTAHAQSVMAPGTLAGCLQNAGNGELACGSGATASPGTGATAIGINAKASADAAMGFGFNANASSISAMAFGKDASATNQGSVAIGQESSSTGMASTALGFAGRALANETVAVGDTATASANFSTALGANASAGFPSSAALGFGAQATAANQMMFGTAANILAAPGIVSAASKAAQQGKVLMVTIDGNGNIATAAIPVCRCPPPVLRPPKKLSRKR
jgi:hypothetical protein